MKVTNIKGVRAVAVSTFDEYAKWKPNNIDAIDQNPILGTAYDIDGKKANDYKIQTIEGKSYKIYPWGNDNLTPQKCISLIRSNGDAMNLINTRADFLYGGGIDFFEEVIDGEQVQYKVFRNEKIRAYRDELEIDNLVGQLVVSLAETWCLIVNRTTEKGVPKLSWIDPSTFRWVQDSVKKIGILSADWNDQSETGNKGKAVAVVSDSSQEDGIIFKKISQVGQPYYPRPTYWSPEALDFLETMNFCAAKIRQCTKSNNFIGQIARISEDYITDLANQTEDVESDDDLVDSQEDENAKRSRVRNNLYEMLNDFMFSGTRTVIFDECRTDPQTGKMVPNIEIQEVKRSLNTKEYSESYELSLRGFANSGGVLAGLTGLSDGGKLGGSGSELKVSANYQQTFRTNRERLLITSLIDRTYRKFLELPDNVVVRFRNLILVNDNADKSGVSATMKTETNPKS